MSEPTTAEERATIRRWAAQGYFLMLGTSRGLGLVSRLLADHDRLLVERDRYEAALRWYAEDRRYMPDPLAPEPESDPDVWMDRGQRARAALAQPKGAGDE